MYNIILDTSFILTALKFKVDVFSELNRICNFKYKISIIDRTLDELKGKKLGKLAVKLLKDKNVNIINTSEKINVDNIIIKLANKDKNIIAATQDLDLKNKLENIKTKIIIIKQKKFLIII